MTSAISVLTNIYQQRAISTSEMPLVGVTSNTAPWELLRAAGLQPVLLSPRRAFTPLADRYMEDIFSARIRAIFDFLISPESAVLSAVVIPRTSEQEHKLFLYLREVVRQGTERAPELALYNLLHSRSAEAEAYGLARTHELKCTLERLTGRPIAPEALSNAITEGNAARQAIRALLEHREGSTSNLRGSEALALIGAWYFMDRTEYALLAQEALREVRTRPPLPRPRLLIKGPPLDNSDFCEAIKSGAIVVAEDDWFGSRAAGRDISRHLREVLFRCTQSARFSGCNCRFLVLSQRIASGRRGFPSAGGGRCHWLGLSPSARFSGSACHSAFDAARRPFGANRRIC
jgi:benzoyl-CoA reductase/2-hydroxyglutaryl-CoA dehydratase subunit BcrC/BadD/HgdB